MTPPEGALQTAVGGVTTPRVVAAGISADLRTGEMLDAAFDRRTVDLDARDRRWLRELIYGMLRQRGAIDAILEERVRGGLARVDPDLVDLMRLGVYQLLHMGSVPAYAAIAQTVELAKVRHGIGASKLMNAVLRRIDRESNDLTVPLPEDPVEALAVKYSHPRWLVARWLARYGEEGTTVLMMKNNAEAPVVIRPYGIVREQLEAMLEGSGIDVEDAPLTRDSIQISGGISLTELGAFKQGLFFVQDPGSTLVTQYAAIAQDSVVADLCAAPGGKTLELSRIAKTVIASDRSLQRLGRLRDNRARLEAHNVFVVVADARFPALREADAVLIDVPCTGTGTFRRHPDARWRLRISDLSIMSGLQSSILKAAARIVKPGGLLIYSTCSLEPEENEKQIVEFLAVNPEWTL
ncbi:MAG TPA: transcription antitermination factor NusB, partial [Gemmatimonadaceae bacterium]|nr:transcription antitermination factor NusB [Gemmatimonadaceae bacterium]